MPGNQQLRVAGVLRRDVFRGDPHGGLGGLGLVVEVGLGGVMLLGDGTSGARARHDDVGRASGGFGGDLIGGSVVRTHLRFLVGLETQEGKRYFVTTVGRFASVVYAIVLRGEVVFEEELLGVCADLNQCSRGYLKLSSEITHKRSWRYASNPSHRVCIPLGILHALQPSIDRYCFRLRQ